MVRLFSVAMRCARSARLEGGDRRRGRNRAMRLPRTDPKPLGIHTRIGGRVPNDRPDAIPAPPPPRAARSLESTKTLILRIRSGDETARNELFARFLPGLRRWAHGRLLRRARELAEPDDLAQNSILHALSRVDEFEPRRPGAFLAHLRRILVNCIREDIGETRAVRDRARAADPRPRAADVRPGAPVDRSRAADVRPGAPPVLFLRSPLQVLEKIGEGTGT